MSRFDPIEGADYGVCGDCGIPLSSEQAAKDHRTETMRPGASSHGTRATNPSRAERIQLFVDSTVEAAIEDALDELGGEDVSDAEIAEALGWHSEFADAWDGR
jgi:ribosome-binding protein aMBF1 (putative translation factor)